MSITSITIENFKGIGSPVTIPIRPITLLFGPNSAGKSTVLHALHYMREVLENRNPDPDKVAMGGDVIDLGGFENLVHKHDQSNIVRIKVEFDIEQGVIVPNDKKPPEDFNFLADPLLKVTPLKNAWVEVVTGMKDSKPSIIEYSVGIDGKYFGKIADIFGMPNIVFLNTEHPAFRAEGYEESFHATATFQKGNDGTFGPMNSIPLEYEQSVIPGWNRDFSFEFADDEESSETTTTSESSSSSEEKSNSVTGYERILFWELMSRLFIRSGEVLLNYLKNSRYIGPIRTVLPRNYTPPKTPNESRWADGTGAWDLLGQSVQIISDEEKFIVDKTSEYLHDTLKLGYSLKVENKYLLPVKGKEIDELKRIATFWDDEVDGTALKRVISDCIEKLHVETRIDLHDEKNNVDVAPCDIGVGVSQIIPVVVGAVDKSCKLLSVEQPELHVHPAVVCDLGDVFIKEFIGTDRTALLETHSEHLVLRIMRRMRETLEKKLSENIPEITPADVSILYVENYDQETIIREMPLNEKGELVKAWPGGFFEEALRETF